MISTLRRFIPKPPLFLQSGYPGPGDLDDMFLADLIVLPDNPLTDVKTLSRLTHVIRAGKMDPIERQ